MNEHPIVPISTIRKHSTKKQHHDQLILNLKVNDLELNFYKGINYNLITSIIDKLVDHD